MITQGLTHKTGSPKKKSRSEGRRKLTWREECGMIFAPVKSAQRLFPHKGGDRMDIAETIALLMLVLAAIKLGIDLKK